MYEIGDKIGFLTIESLNNEDKKGRSWNCRCVCGEGVKLSEASLKISKSCGCKQFRQKGLTVKNPRLNAIYRLMKYRCYKTHNKDYENYGRKGVTVCDEWLEDYSTFYEWAMSNGYHDDLEIDRIDPKGNYEPENCRWVDEYTQSQNQGLQKNNTTGYKGIFKRKYGYVASIRRFGKRYHLGHFKYIEDAIRAREIAEKELIDPQQPTNIK